MHLPKLEYPKRPLAVTPEQMEAVKMVYEPFLPTPPIGIHKILAKQLRMDEWRVHVAIGLIRKQMNLPRWNEDREDLPPQMKQELQAILEKKQQEEGSEEVAVEAPPPKKVTAKKTATKKAAKATVPEPEDDSEEDLGLDDEEDTAEIAVVADEVTTTKTTKKPAKKRTS